MLQYNLNIHIFSLEIWPLWESLRYLYRGYLMFQGPLFAIINTN